MSEGLPARKAALAMLGPVLTRRKPLDTELPQLKALPPRDAAFARALASQCLRHYGALDAVLRKFLKKPLAPHKSGAAMEILLLGACELLVLKTPAHAAVDAANRLAQADAKAVHFKPLVNAVLRKVAGDGAAIFSNLDRERLCTPDWLWQRWSAQYDPQTARQIARAHQAEAPLDITLRSADAVHPESIALFGLARRVTQSERVEDLPGFAAGGWWVQDAAATLPATLLGDVNGKSVIDLCAAPGGKTLQLAAAGAQVTAIDLDPARLARVEANLQRTNLSATLVATNALDFDGSADCVLVDAPCTATGTIRRHPDLPWIKEAGDAMGVATKALEILEAGACMVKPGGLLVFAVCSLDKEEGEEQAHLFLDRNPQFVRVPVSSEEIFGHNEWITPDGDLRTLPFQLEDGMDGFFAARFKRSETA